MRFDYVVARARFAEEALHQKLNVCERAQLIPAKLADEYLARRW